jgi:ethanolamine utilization protein EutA
MLTPYVTGEEIDSDFLRRFVNRCYREAALTQDDVDTGALILTGVAVRRRNARAIAESFATDAGKFVCVSAGDALEATMAAQGSGAARRSAAMPGTVLNIDIGGGTTKVARCRAGRVEQVTAIEGGARLVVVDAAGRIVRLERAAHAYAHQAGLDVSLGDILSPTQMMMIADRIAACIVQAAGLAPLSPDARSLLRLPPLEVAHGPRLLIFSGGVSEFIYGRSDSSYGDLGQMVADRILAWVQTTGIAVEEPQTMIRATVIGASQYTIQVSGATIFIHPPGVVPVRNVPVVVADFDLSNDEIDPQSVRTAIHKVCRGVDTAGPVSSLALAFKWRGSATFQRLQAFCAGVRTAIQEILPEGRPIILVSDGDVGGLLGTHFVKEMHWPDPIISIDGVRLAEFDFIDIGSPLGAGAAVPVTVKSLIFPADE